MNPLVDLLLASYRANAQPATFFAGDPYARRPRPALVTLLAANLLASLALALLLDQAGAPSLAVPWWLILPALLLPYVALLTAIGALVSMRTRGFQPALLALHAWSWTPSAPLALLALPIGFLDARLALLGFVLALPLAHTVLVTFALRSVDPAGWRHAVTLHLLAVFAVPALLTALPLGLLAGRT